MKSLRKSGDQESRMADAPGVLSSGPVSPRQTWWSVLAWTALTVLVFLILARLGFKAAQARRVTWLVAACGACYAAIQALVCEVRHPRRLPFSLMIVLGGVGGFLVAVLLGMLGLLPVGIADLCAGAVFGMLFGGLEYWRSSR